jgi:hypothetical protein
MARVACRQAGRGDRAARASGLGAYETKREQQQFFNALGDSIAVVAVRLSEIEPLRADEVLAVRQLAKAG